MQEVRVFFSKTGNVKYISHLDLYRSMLRAVKRARLPVWYTQGFNPQPYIAFTLPLSLGIEGENESMDMRLEGEMSCEELKAALSKVMPEGLSIINVRPVKDAAKTIRYASYRLELEFLSAADAKAFYETALEVIEKGELIAEKPAKKGKGKTLKEVNIVEHVQRFEAKIDNNYVLIEATLSAGSTANLNPFLLSEALEAQSGIEIAAADIIRKQLFKADLSPFE